MTGAASRPAPTVESLPPRILEDSPVVVVVGDVLLDRWWSGASERLSREAPAPVVELVERVDAPGGAGNTAMNLAALGARVRLVGMVGDDEAGSRVLDILDSAAVDVRGVLRSGERSTVTKTRIVADGQMLVRVDDGIGRVGADALDDVDGAMAAALDTALDGAAAVLVCDYGSGLLLGAVRDRLARDAGPGRERLTVVDAHDLAPWSIVAPDVVTPNEAEAALLLRRAHRGSGLGPDRVASFVDETEALLEVSGADVVVVTLDRDGTVALRPDADPFVTRAHPAAEKFASGAGDTFVAALTAALACGAELEHATTLAQHAADVVVGHFGTAVCTTDDLARRVSFDGPVAMGVEELDGILTAVREDGRRIVFTNGCFDVLHRGHTTYLRQARELGDVLVVGINSDDSVRRLKGPERPINGAVDRAAVLAALECVDFVTIFETDTPIPLLERFTPHVYVKGGDYSPEMLRETPVVRAYGGEVRIVDYVSSHSTTSMVARIRSRQAGGAT